jgi:hypothetical protein
MTTVSLSKQALAIAGCLAVAAGCGGGKSASANAVQQSHVRLLTAYYSSAVSKLGHAPRDEQEFKSAINLPPASMEKFNIKSLDELFVSERDGQPLVVAYGASRPASDIVVYEKTGVDGKRLVGRQLGMVDEVDDATFNNLIAGKK